MQERFTVQHLRMKFQSWLDLERCKLVTSGHLERHRNEMERVLLVHLEERRCIAHSKPQIIFGSLLHVERSGSMKRC